MSQANPGKRTSRNDELELVTSRGEQALARVIGFVDLSSGQKLKLYARLINAKQHYEMRQNVANIPADSAAEAVVNEIRKSAQKLAAFSVKAIGARSGATGTLKAEKAFRMLCEAADHWQSKATDNNSYGKPWNKSTAIDATDFLHGFLVAAQHFNEIVKLAPVPAEGRKLVFFALTPAERFHGGELPEIYFKIFSRKFTATSETNFANTSDRIQFIHAARFALGMGKIADQTVRNYCQAARTKQVQTCD